MKKLFKTMALTMALIMTAVLGACAMPGENAPEPPAAAEPAAPGEAQGVLSSFTAADIDGNEVDEGIFKGYKLTMVNIWGTFSGPCIAEMPDLGVLSDEYADKGVRIIGIAIDVADDEGKPYADELAAAQQIRTDTGADYLHILPSASLHEALLGDIRYVPTTIFVDESGAKVGEEYVGSRSADEWREIIDATLGETVG